MASMYSSANAAVPMYSSDTNRFISSDQEKDGIFRAVDMAISVRKEENLSAMKRLTKVQAPLLIQKGSLHVFSRIPSDVCVGPRPRVQAVQLRAIQDW